MLNRVKDFRYSEIKNWKPIASLRQSYQSDTRVFVVIGFGIVCFVIAGLALSPALRQNWQDTAAGGKLDANQQDGSSQHRGLKQISGLKQEGLTGPELGLQDHQGSGAFGQKKSFDNHSETDTAGRMDSQTLGSGMNGFKEGAQDLAGNGLNAGHRALHTPVSASRPQLTSQNVPVSDTRVGIVRVRDLFSKELRAFRATKKQEFEQMLDAELKQFRRIQPVQDGTRAVERELYQLQQAALIKKQLFALQLQIKEERYLEKLMESVMTEMRQISRAKRLEAVIRSDRALISNRECDITDDLIDLLNAPRTNPIGRSASRFDRKFETVRFDSVR